MKNEYLVRRYSCPPPCNSTDLTSIKKDEFERKGTWKCNKCGKEFEIPYSDDSTDGIYN